MAVSSLFPVAEGTSFILMAVHALRADTAGMRFVPRTDLPCDFSVIVMTSAAVHLLFSLVIGIIIVMAILTADRSPVIVIMVAMRKKYRATAGRKKNIRGVIRRTRRRDQIPVNRDYAAGDE